MPTTYTKYTKDKAEEQHEAMKRISDEELLNRITAIAIGIPVIIMLIYFIVS